VKATKAVERRWLKTRVWVRRNPKTAKAMLDVPVAVGSLAAIVVGFWLISPAAGLIVGGLVGLSAVGGRKTLSLVLRGRK
jgi:divalent metal cation (Fe/Co/Zn/Cd) transporter